MEPVSIDVIEQATISHASALQLASMAVEKAEEMGIAISACVVDIQGRVKAQVIMDGTAIIADELVVKKARTALLGMPSADLGEAVAASPIIAQSMLQLNQVTLLGGGFPLLVAGQIVAGFAVGGALVEQDIACAQAVLAAVTS